MGEELPLGVFCFHTTLRSLLISEGSPRSVEIPVPFGPRKRGQSEAGSKAAQRQKASRRMPFLGRTSGGLERAEARFWAETKANPSGVYWHLLGTQKNKDSRTAGDQMRPLKRAFWFALPGLL